ncbi:MAG: MATE family efflux transporter [Hungatella sp.]
MKANLTEKDKAFREFALTGSIWSVVLYIGIPLALYQSLTQIFKVFDTMMAAHISAASVSAVAYLSQLSGMLSALGGGLAVGASIRISEAYGAGDFALVKKRVSTLFTLCGLLGLLLLIILVPFAPQFLRLAKTPEAFMASGVAYFRLELLAMVISFFNNVYIAIERARGNSKRILYLNFFILGIKLLLTAFFVYVLHAGINMIAVATIVSQGLLLLASIKNLNERSSAFGFSLRSISLRREVVQPMILLSIPVIAEKVAFSMGKVIINSMSTIYNALTVGALSISNTISGFTTMPQNGFQEGGAAIISQNLGAKQVKRALQTFGCVLIINVLLGVFLMSGSLICLQQISSLFAGNDLAFQHTIASIYRMEAYGAIPLGVNAAVMSLLYGFGKTKLTLLINFSRLFIFRVPLLWFLQQFTDLGDISVGIVMGISNTATGIMSMIVGAIVIHSICKENDIVLFDFFSTHPFQVSK